MNWIVAIIPSHKTENGCIKYHIELKIILTTATLNLVHPYTPQLSHNTAQCQKRDTKENVYVNMRVMLHFN